MFAINENTIEAQSADLMRIHSSVRSEKRRHDDLAVRIGAGRWPTNLLSPYLRGLAVVVCRLQTTQIVYPLFFFFVLCLLNVITQQFRYLRPFSFETFKIEFQLRHQTVDSSVQVFQRLRPSP